MADFLATTTWKYREALGLRLLEVTKKFDTKSDAASAGGVSVEQFNKWLKGAVKVPADALYAIAQKADVDFSWLATGEGGPLRGPADDVMVPSNASTDLDQSNFVRLPVFSEVFASAGYGTIPTSERANNVIAFDRGFLRDQGGNPEKCSIIFARGTSMKPTIPDGAILVVDHSQRDVAHGCIYVFNVGEQLLVKRARWRLDGRLELVSDNVDEGYPVETFGPETVEHLRVVGRVIYLGRVP